MAVAYLFDLWCLVLDVTQQFPPFILSPGQRIYYINALEVGVSAMVNLPFSDVAIRPSLL